MALSPSVQAGHGKPREGPEAGDQVARNWEHSSGEEMLRGQGFSLAEGRLKGDLIAA